MGFCSKKHNDPLFLSIMPSLNPDQGGTGRHICPGCAYERGYQDGLQKKPQIDQKTLQKLPESQKVANGRHKSAWEAYLKGYQAGLQKFYADRQLN